MEMIFALNNYKENPVNPNIPDGIYNGNWHSSGSFADAYPEIELHPEFASRSMDIPRATIWVFKPHVLFIEGEGRPLEFPITLGFSGDGKLLTVDGGTDFVPFLPQNLEDYSNMNPETKKNCFIIEVELPFGGGLIKTEQTKERLKIIENFRCPDCCLVEYTNKFGITKTYDINNGKEVFTYENGRTGAPVDADLEERILNLYFKKVDKKR